MQALSAWLFYLVSRCMKLSSETVLLRSIVQEEYDKATTARERVKVIKKQRLIPGYDYHRVVAIGVICAVGIFNRPTFAAFALVPVFFWLQRGLQVGSYFQPFMVINFRAALLGIGEHVCCDRTTKHVRNSKFFPSFFRHLPASYPAGFSLLR